MATAGPIDQAEYDRWVKSGGSCPKVVRRQPWMHGDIRQPLKLTRPRASVKLPSGWRKAHELCGVAMAAGRIWSWSFESESGHMIVKLDERSDWLEFDLPGGVLELLDGLEGGPVVVAVQESVKVPPVKRAPVVAPVETPVPVTVAVAPPVAVRPSVAVLRPSTVMPGPVAEYLARLVFEPKRAYAAALATHLLHPSVAPMPSDPGTEWAGKVRVKLARLVPAGRDLVAVAS